MLLIATDEAGYGPKLGPLVIVGTAWQIPGDEILPSDALAELFAPLRVRQSCGGQSVVVDDSKAVFKPSAGLDALHAVVSASLHWCNRPEQTLDQWLLHVSAKDLESMARAAWLDGGDDDHFLAPETTGNLLSGWQSSGVSLADIQSRVITAEAFNTACQDGGNKADLLSESTLGLVRWLVDLHGPDQQSIAVYCDRHGGRRYYASVLQHVFPDAQLQVIAESKQQSVYRLTSGPARIDVHFTVKGDSFTPVALASMHAKYLRERLMQRFNAFFAARHRESVPLKPTAGYPVDADRFLAAIQPIIQREQIPLQKLVRNR